MSELIDLGPLVRDSSHPERVLKQGIKAFYKWAIADAHLSYDANIPNFIVKCGSRHASTAALKALMHRSLKKLAQRYRQHYADVLEISSQSSSSDVDSLSETSEEAELLDKLPTVYGVLVSDTAFAIVSYSLARGDDSLRTIGVFNFKDMPMDVWNSIAIMVLVVHCRNCRLDLQKALPALSTPSSRRGVHWEKI